MTLSLGERIGTDILLGIASICYLLATSLYFTRLLGRPHARESLARPLITTAALFHTAHFLIFSLLLRACPVNQIHGATSLVALLSVYVFLVVRRFYSVDVVGSFVAPVALVAMLASRFINVQERPQLVRNALLPFHVTTLLVASAFFVIASALSVTYLVQEKVLKKKRVLRILNQLPPLNVLDNVSYRFLLAGFPLLTIGIMTGLLWIGEVSSSSMALARQGLAYAAWAIFAMVLLMRTAVGWRGKRFAFGILAGFFCAVLVFVMYLLRRAGVA